MVVWNGMGQSFVYDFGQPGLLQSWKARSKPISVPALPILRFNLANTPLTHSINAVPEASEIRRLRQYVPRYCPADSWLLAAMDEGGVKH